MSEKTITGVVRDFFIDRGYGFIVPDDQSGDVFFHKSQVGHRQLGPGTRVECVIAPDARGLMRVRKLLSADTSQAVFASNTPVTARSDWTGATVKFYDPLRGYGFAVLDDLSGDAFFHFSILRRDGVQNPAKGERLRVRYKRDEDGRMTVTNLQVEIRRDKK